MFFACLPESVQKNIFSIHFLILLMLHVFSRFTYYGSWRIVMNDYDYERGKIVSV